VKKLLAPALAALLAFGFQPITAQANDDTVIPSSRFATYTTSVNPNPGAGLDSTEATITMPAGFPSARAVKSPATNDSREKLEVGNLGRVILGPFRDRFTEDGVAPEPPEQFLSLPGFQTVGGSSTTTITFDSPFPANHLGINLEDIDSEDVYMTVFDAQGQPIPFSRCGFEGVYNSRSDKTAVPDFVADPGSATPPDTAAPDACIKIFDTVSDTQGSSIWFVPTVSITQIVLKETSRARAYFGFFAADRPTPTITPTPSVPTSYTIGNTALSITPDMFQSSFVDGILVGDFPIDPIIQFRVANNGGTGCTLTSTSPTTLTATSSGTCTLEAFIAETPDYKGASVTFPITISQTPPPPTPPTKPTPDVQWQPDTTEFSVDRFPAIITPTPPPPPPGGGSYNFTTNSTSTSTCTVNATTATMTVPQPGTCVITATVEENKKFARGSITVTFTITGPALAATGAPAWPVWAGVAGLIGAGLLAWARLSRHGAVRVSQQD